MSATSVPLSTSWVWKRLIPGVDKLETLVPAVTDKQASSVDGWSECRSFPSDIYVELIEAGLIPDPFVGFNEHKVQWVADEHWIWGCQFELDCIDQVQKGDLKAEIVFEGLDTFCAVYLNGKLVHKTDNMFISTTLSLNPQGCPISRNNHLLLVFTSAKRMAKKLEASYGAVRAGSVNLGDPSRVYARKAQYHWRWDWGPELITCGPWKPVVLKLYASRIVQLQSSATVEVELGEATLTLITQIESVKPRDVGVEMTLKDHEGSTIWKERAELDGKRSELVAQVKFPLDTIQLWWPVGYGEATLYELKVRLLDKGQVLDQTTRQVGFRDIQLCQLPLNGLPGTSFYFRVNGVKMFMGGSNWIPADSFLTRLNKEKYLAWLRLLKRGRQNMIRVWGGGIYEDDEFYNICDELGILVWQDFAFACGVYPAHASFVNSVKQEAEHNIRRLRHHPISRHTLWK